MKAGRNDPCPCGSGKKYKHCCLATAQAQSQEPADLAWKRIRRALEGFQKRLLQFMLDAYGSAAIDEAWGEYSRWDGSAFETDTPHLSVFMPWMLHCWSPGEETGVADASLHHVAPTQAFLQRKSRHIEPLLRQYLEACLASRFGFFEVERCEPGHGLRVRDVFTGERSEVLERSASQAMQEGDLFYGLMVQVDGITLIEGFSPFPIPPLYKIALVQLRQQIQQEPIGDWEDELREQYLEINAQLLDPVLPEVLNADGEKIVLHRLQFDIDSPQAAFDALKHLDSGSTQAELLEHAQRDAQGGLWYVELAWKKPDGRIHSSLNDTILGSIRIDGTRLSVEVNSVQRALQINKIVEQALGARARHRVTEVESIDFRSIRGNAPAAPAQNTRRAFTALSQARSWLAEMRAGHYDALAEQLILAPDDRTPPDVVQDRDGRDPAQNTRRAFMALSQVRSWLAEMKAGHYGAWVEQPIPALGDRTPLDAVQDRDGREMVEALVRQIERDGRALEPPLDEAIVRKLRERLGLNGVS